MKIPSTNAFLGPSKAAASLAERQSSSETIVQTAEKSSLAAAQRKMQEAAATSVKIWQGHAIQRLVDSKQPASKVTRAFGRFSAYKADCASQNALTVQRYPDDDNRPNLGKKLMSGLFSASNWSTRLIFKTMNAAMWAEGQPLGAQHKKALEDNLFSGKGLYETLSAENKYVMESSGYTPIYLLGKNFVHRPLRLYNEYKSGK